MDSSFWAWGLRVGRLAGITIRIHWTLLIYWAFRIEEVLRAGDPLWVWALIVGVSFLCILLHEFGHCFAARSVGGSAHDVLLWPLGGLAFCAVPRHWRSQFIVSAGGPLVTLALMGSFYALARIAPAFSDASESPFLRCLYYVMVDWQLVLLVFNLLPLWPLDGGGMFRAGAWYGFQRFGRGYEPYYRATMATLWVSRVTAALGILYAVLFAQFFLIFLFAWAWANVERLRYGVEDGGSQDGYLGYDFSQGYTSLERSSREGREGVLSRLRRLLARRQAGSAPSRDRSAERHADERRRVDELLAKVSRDGLPSLSRRERNFLRKVGKRWSSRT